MGDECFEILAQSLAEIGLLERLYLNINRNMLSKETMVEALKSFEKLASLSYLELEAKKNLRKIEDKDEVRAALNALPVKGKKIDI
jgi:hypothetical protein